MVESNSQPTIIIIPVTDGPSIDLRLIVLTIHGYVHILGTIYTHCSFNSSINYLLVSMVHYTTWNRLYNYSVHVSYLNIRFVSGRVYSY